MNNNQGRGCVIVKEISVPNRDRDAWDIQYCTYGSNIHVMLGPFRTRRNQRPNVGHWYFISKFRLLNVLAMTRARRSMIFLSCWIVLVIGIGGQTQSMTLPFTWPNLKWRQQQHRCCHCHDDKKCTNKLLTMTGVHETVLGNHHPSLVFRRNDLFLGKLQKKISSRFLELHKQWIVGSYPKRKRRFDFHSTTSTSNSRWSTSTGHCRTRFMFRLPLPEDLYRIMFDGKGTATANTADPVCDEIFTQETSHGFLAQQAQIMSQFNHDHVGITRPLLLSSQSDNDLGQYQQYGEPVKQYQQQLDEDGLKNTLSINVCDFPSQSGFYYFTEDHHHDKNHNHDDDHDLSLQNHLWWPNSQREIGGTKCSSTTMDWRIKRYRKRLGRGRDCYNRVRDAVLDWEFQNNQHGDAHSDTGGWLLNGKQHNDMGIQRAVPHSSLVSHNRQSGCPLPEENMNPNVLQICNSLFSPTHKKLVTYTQVNLMPFCETLEHVGKKCLSHSGGRNSNGSGAGLGTAVGKLVLGFINIIPTIYVINPVRVIYDIVDEQLSNGDLYTCSAYATMGGHLLRGEERVCVIFRGSDAKCRGLLSPRYTSTYEGKGLQIMPVVTNGVKDHNHGYVDVEILSYSKPALNMLGLLVWPFIGKKQEDFFQCQLRELERVAIQSLDKEENQSSTSKSNHE